MASPTGNHLGTSAVEVTDTGAIITYEEYHPYGTSVLRIADGSAQVSDKRYRYAGKERDAEAALYYNGARYYEPLLGSWTATDPAGVGADGVDPDQYCPGANHEPAQEIPPSATRVGRA